MRKRWTIAASLSVVGMAMFMIASVMAGRFDKWQIAEAQDYPSGGGQFNGSGQQILHLVFFWLFVCAVVVGLLAFGIAALLKWSTRWLVRATYGTLFYWCGLVPVVAHMFFFPALALCGGIMDWLKYMR